jgi:hypothetical protein
MDEGKVMPKYSEPKSGQWVEPIRRKYKLACCDCGLVHALNFRLIKNDHGRGKRIQFKAYRDYRATGQVRRWMKKQTRLIL